MAKQGITVELDDETIRLLAALGQPSDLLAHLAYAAADSVRHPGRVKREQTDESLRGERNKSDVALANERAALEELADEVVRVARQRADQVVLTARDVVEVEPSPRVTATEGSAARARAILEVERSAADAVLKGERAGRRNVRAGFLAKERDTTDRDLTGERTHSDSLIIDQREANEQMVRATIRAQELAVEAEEARGRAEKSEGELRAVAEFREMFIGILAHDLRNPVGAIVIGAATLLQRGRLNEQDAETVARIIRSSQRVTRMIGQVLDLTSARLGGGLKIEPRPTDLREVLGNVVGEFEATLQVVVEGDVTGTWDPDRLAQVVSNLVRNAIEYANPATVVTLKARADGADVVVEISNRGAPIPVDILPVIFEPFRRARERETSATGNLGLGLYIARQIMLSHGGTLDAHSADGTTTFVMRLPRRTS